MHIGKVNDVEHLLDRKSVVLQVQAKARMMTYRLQFSAALQEINGFHKQYKLPSFHDVRWIIQELISLPEEKTTLPK